MKLEKRCIAVTDKLSLINTLTSCPKCGAAGRFKLSSTTRVECTDCDTSYSYDSEILDFVAGRQRTALDDIDYDERYSVEEQLFDEFRSLMKWTDPLFDEHFDKILEIGAGTGGLSIGMLTDADIGSALITDISPNMLAQCRKRALHYDIKTPVLFATNNGEQLNVRDETFDLIIAYFCVHHILNYEKFVAACHRALRPGGKAVFVEPGLRFLRALFSCFSPAIERMALDSENWGTPNFSAVLGVHQHMYFTSKYADDLKVVGELEDKHVFGRYEFEQVVQDAGFYQVQTIPYGVADHPLHALRVYAEQRGASPEFMNAFIEEVETELPGPFLLLDPHEAAPSLAFVLQKPNSLAKEAGAENDPLDPVASHKPHIAPERTELRYDISIELPKRENGTMFRIDGWIVSRRPVDAINFETASKRISLPVGSISRPDVFAAYSNINAYSAGAALHCGFSSEHSKREAPFKRGESLRVQQP